MKNPQVNGSSTKFVTALCAVALLLSLAALRLPGQNLSGKFRGNICDPSGAPIPSAAIAMTNRNASTVDMTTSSTDGNFTFTALPSGEYEMRVLKRGFEEYEAPHIVLEAGRDSSQNIVLKVGTISEDVDVVAEKSVKTVPEATLAKPAQARSGGDLQGPKLLNIVKPTYPAVAKSAGIEGTVVLHAVISMEGTPLSVRVMNSKIDPELAHAAVDAVSKWRYSPSLLNGEPIEVDTTITVNFKLSSWIA